MDTSSARDRKLVSTWLLIGIIMVFVQILLGGITRLTGSGLSITKWDIVIGSVPPLTSADWIETFDLYKQTPQYQKINEGMGLQQFKFIFFWEYFHRLWARTMGFVFLFPFFFFLFRRSLSNIILKRLGIVVLLAAIAALFGWIMVASGLVNRPWVNAYKLTVHLGLGISLFMYLFYTWIKERGYRPMIIEGQSKRFICFLLILVILQVCFGGMVSGMKSSLLYPTWPLMNDRWIPDILWDTTHWKWDSFLLYDHSVFVPTLVQVIHRNLAYLITLLVLVFSYGWIKSQNRRLLWVSYILIGIVLVQVLVGILILLGSHGSIPVFYGVLHQGLGILTLTFLFYIKIKANTRHITL